MKKLTLVFSLLAIFVLSGCGLHEFNVGDPLVGLEATKEASKVACYNAQARNVVDTGGLSELGKVMLLQQQSYERMVSAFTGKSFDPCGGGTNLNDVLIADSNNRNRSVQVLGGGALSVVKFGLGVWSATEIVDSIGKNAGSTSNVDTNGGDSSISTSRTQTETNTHSTASNTGEEGVSTTNPTSAEPVFTDPAVTPIITAE